MQGKLNLWNIKEKIWNKKKTKSLLWLALLKLWNEDTNVELFYI
jgi:hypothetical protein